MNHWLLKSEPDSFSIDDLGKAPKQTTAWDGVRNYQARNMLRDSIKKADLAFFYYSSCDVPGIAGIVSIAREGIRMPAPSTRRTTTTIPIPKRMHPLGTSSM